MARMHKFKQGSTIYHIAIIDYLQAWTQSKKVERLTKTILLGKDGKTLSAIEPDKYAQRF